jgi:hypothetical protein
VSNFPANTGAGIEAGSENTLNATNSAHYHRPRFGAQSAHSVVFIVHGDSMRSVRLTTLGTVMLASALPVVGAVLVIVDHPRAPRNAAPELLQSQLHLDVRTLSGKITRKSGKFIFREDHLNVTYILDDQQAAKKFFGKNVLLTGTVNAETNVVHIHKIELT